MTSVTCALEGESEVSGGRTIRHVALWLGTPLTASTIVPLPAAPKLAPLMTTDWPIPPDEGTRGGLITGVGITAKLTPLLSTPLAWTTTFPVVAPAGTGTAILVALQVVTVAVVPLNFTVLMP